MALNEKHSIKKIKVDSESKKANIFNYKKNGGKIMRKKCFPTPYAIIANAKLVQIGSMPVCQHSLPVHQEKKRRHHLRLLFGSYFEVIAMYS